jgi:hypothetical protein
VQPFVTLECKQRGRRRYWLEKKDASCPLTFPLLILLFPPVASFAGNSALTEHPGSGCSGPVPRLRKTAARLSATPALISLHPSFSSGNLFRSTKRSEEIAHDQR